MEGIKQNLITEFALFFWVVLAGFCIAGIYLIVKKLILQAIARSTGGMRQLARIRIIEKVFGPVFFTAVAVSLILSNTIVGLATSFFFTGVLWKPINNYFLGLIYMTDKKYTVGQRIRYRDMQGTIRAFNNLALEIELEDGAYVDIPYRDFADTAVIRTSPKSGIISHSITIPIPKPCNLDTEKQRLQGILLAQPWVLPNQKIFFEQMEEEEDQYLVKVVIHGIDKNHLYKVENKIKAMRQKNRS